MGAYHGPKRQIPQNRERSTVYEHRLSKEDRTSELRGKCARDKTRPLLIGPAQIDQGAGHQARLFYCPSPVTKMRKDVTQIANLIEPVLKGTGLDLVEIDWGREEGGWVLRVYIDHPQMDAPEVSILAPPPSVTFDDCERASRDISATLDVADLITHAYRLEVSSPGIDRPLRRETDFRRFAGRQVKVRTLDPVDGRRNFSGTLLGASEGLVDVECEGRAYKIPVIGVARANLVPDWDAEFKKAERSAS